MSRGLMRKLLMCKMNPASNQETRLQNCGTNNEREPLEGKPLKRSDLTENIFWATLAEQLWEILGRLIMFAAKVSSQAFPSS